MDFELTHVNIRQQWSGTGHERGLRSDADRCLLRK
jgi:hypothetical protein